MSFVCPECGATRAAPGSCEADGAQLQPRGDDVLLGTMIGPYRMAKLMGIGGMGRVYKAVHPSIGSRVAVKVLSRELADRRDVVERFFAEAKTVNMIKHESIVNVLDLSMLPDGRPYIVMEYLDGSSLAAVIEEARRSGRPLPLGGVAKLVGEVLGGLGAAHAKGIIHRDLKPDNVYVTPQGRIKVLDFGIAKLQPEFGGAATQTGSLLGTPHYMSPEQAAGRAVDPRADLYAVGVILFECATLHRPFEAAALFDMLKMHIEQPPPSPRSLRPDLPEGIEAVILTALAKSPDHRFASTQAMGAALQHAASGLPAEQWTTILPRAARPTAPVAWAPTPPASWAGGSSNTELPRAQDTAPDPMAPTQASQPDDAPLSLPRSRKGLWLALGGLALAGGGVAAGVILAGRDTSSTQSTAGSGSGSTTVVVQAPPADAEVITPTPVARQITNEPLTPEKAAELDHMVPMLLDMIPAEKRPPEVKAALQKYGSWTKIPDAQRMKLLDQILAVVMQGPGAGLIMGGGTGDLLQDVFDGLEGEPVRGMPVDAGRRRKAAD